MTLDNQGLPVLLCSDWLYLKMLQPFLFSIQPSDLPSLPWWQCVSVNVEDL